MHWWLQYVLAGPLGALLMASVKVSKNWDVFSMCSGEMADNFVYDVQPDSFRYI